MLQAVPSEDLPLLAGSVVGGVLLGVPAAYCFVRGSRKGVRALSLWRDDPVPAFDAANAGGTVELEGRAVPDESRLVAPFTELPCLACRYEVEEYEASGQSSYWKTLHESVQHVPFRVEDDSGRMLVDPGGADLSLASADTVEVDRGETAPEPIASFLGGIGVEPGDGEVAKLGPIEVDRGDRRRYSEARIDPGDTVHVYGPVEQDFTVAEGAGDVNAVVRRSAGDGPFVVSNTDESGVVWRTVLDAVSDLGWGLLFLLGVVVVGSYAAGALGFL